MFDCDTLSINLVGNGGERVRRPRQAHDPGGVAAGPLLGAPRGSAHTPNRMGQIGHALRADLVARDVRKRERGTRTIVREPPEKCASRRQDDETRTIVLRIPDR